MSDDNEKRNLILVFKNGDVKESMIIDAVAYPSESGDFITIVADVGGEQAENLRRMALRLKNAKPEEAVAENERKVGD